MKHKLLIAGLTLGLSIGTGVIDQPVANIAYAREVTDKISNIDTKDLETQVAAAEYLLNNFPKTITDENRAKLEKEVKKAKGLLDRVKQLKTQNVANDNLNIRVKNQIRANVDKRATNFTINVNAYTTNKQIQDWFLETAKEDWYFFYSMYEKANVATKYNPKKAQGDKVYTQSATFTVKYREDIEVEKAVEDFADRWVANNISIADTDYSKVQKIHDFIVTKNQYNRGDSKDKSGEFSIFHPASILYGNGGVCNAYATLFDKLGTKAGLEVRYATGYSKKTGEPHIWNMVKVDGNWYNVDATWDDPTITFNQGNVANLDEFILYDYFLKSDAEIEQSRTIDEDPDRPKGTSVMDTGLKNPTIQKVGDEYRVVR